MWSWSAYNFLRPDTKRKTMFIEWLVGSNFNKYCMFIVIESYSQSNNCNMLYRETQGEREKEKSHTKIISFYCHIEFVRLSDSKFPSISFRMWTCSIPVWYMQYDKYNAKWFSARVLQSERTSWDIVVTICTYGKAKNTIHRVKGRQDKSDMNMLLQ